jgi:hypothetical protein
VRQRRQREDGDGDQRHRRREQAERRHDGHLLGDGDEREDELDEEPGDPQALTGVHAGRGHPTG